MLRLQGKNLAASPTSRKGSAGGPALTRLAGPSTPGPLRFIAAEDIPAHGILSGDLITAPTDRGVRILREVTIQPGLLYTLAKQHAIIELEGSAAAASAPSLSLLRPGA